jgi:outer membrane receptor for ferrienterochelin and colicins
MKSHTSGRGIPGRIFLAVLTLTFVLGWPQVSLSMELDGESGCFLLEDIVVTGTKRDRVVENAPIRTEVISSEDIEVKGNATLYEILESAPGIRVEQQCSYCNFSQVRMQGLESGHVQILVDGQPIFSGLAGVYGLDQIPAGSIEKVEIIKGASSALYGPQSIGGVINIITKRPGKEPYMKVGSEFGAHKTNRYYGEAAVSKGDLDILVTATHWYKGPIDEDKDGIWDRVESTNTNVGLGVNYYSLFGEDRLTLNGRFGTEGRKGGEVETYENPFAESAEHIDTNRIEASLIYSMKFSNGGELLANLAFADHERSATNDTFVGDFLDINGYYPGSDLLRPYEAYEDLYVADANYSHPIGERILLLLGTQYSYNTLDETGMYVIVDPFDPNRGEAYESKSEKWAKELGVYTQAEYTAIEDTLEIVVGARWDSHESEDEFRGSGSVALIDVTPSKLDEEMWNPRVGLMFRPDDHLTIRGAVGTGFRVPYGFSEDLHLCSGSPRVYKPADLEPERSVSYSLSSDYRTETIALGLSYFNTEVEDKIGLSDASQRAQELNYDYQWENLGNATSQGVEFESRFILPCNLDLTGWVTYTDAKYDEARPDWVDNPTHGNRYRDDSVYMSRMPEWEGSVSATWSPANVVFNLSLNYTGSMYIDYYQDENPEAPNSKIKHTDPFWTVNTRLAYKSEEHGLTLFVGGKNILNGVQDERHPDDAAFIYAPLYGRIVYGGIEFEF